MKLAGTTALVTGSSRGIGRAIAIALGRSGANVVLNARQHSPELDAAVKEVEAAGAKVFPCPADVRDPEAVARMAGLARDHLGPVDILVNCAASRPEGPFEQMSYETWRNVTAAILDGAFLCTRAVIGGMLEGGQGAIINIIGLTGQAGAPERAHVVAAKSGLIGLTKALAAEYAGRNITVNGVSPGVIDTPRVGEQAGIPAHRRAGRPIPVGRPGTVDEVASLVCYLASEDARYITGQVYAINGGLYM